VVEWSLIKLFSLIHTVSREKYSLAQDRGDRVTKRRKLPAKKALAKARTRAVNWKTLRPLYRFAGFAP